MIKTNSDLHLESVQMAVTANQPSKTPNTALTQPVLDI